MQSSSWIEATREDEDIMTNTDFPSDIYISRRRRSQSQRQYYYTIMNAYNKAVANNYDKTDNYSQRPTRA